MINHPFRFDFFTYLLRVRVNILPLADHTIYTVYLFRVSRILSRITHHSSSRDKVGRVSIGTFTLSRHRKMRYEIQENTVIEMSYR